MQTLDKLTKIESDILLLEECLSKEDVEQAEHLLQAISIDIQETFTSKSIASSQEIQESALKLYAAISQMVDKVATQRQETAKSLSSHISNKKKISAYKST